MTPFEQMLQYAQDHNIHIHPHALAGALAIAFQASGQAAVAIDLDALESSPEQAVALAHEIGHIETGTLHGDIADYVPPSKDEHKALTWSIATLLPEARLDAAIAKYQGCMWEVAEYLGLPQKFIQQAVDYYASKG